jgi:hypothetical protein
MATGHHWQGGRAPGGADPATPPLLLSPSPSPLATHREAAAGGHPWRPEEREVIAAAGPLAGVRARPWLSTSPSSGLVVVPYIACATTVGAAWFCSSSHTASRPVGGDDDMTQVGPPSSFSSFTHSPSRVRVRVPVTVLCQSEIGSFLCFFSPI